MKVVVFTSEFGNVGVLVPCERSAEDVLRIDAARYPDARIVDDSDLPSEKMDYISAWRIHPENGTVHIDMDAAREQHKEYLRLEREPLLAAQDVLFQRALEAGEDTSAIVAEKRRLRDITNLVYACNTVEELELLRVRQ